MAAVPKEFRFEVIVERTSEGVLLRPKLSAKPRTFSEVARYLEERFPNAPEFPDVERSRAPQVRDLTG